ncbi:MAG: HRDC domain-containing protein [Planctomycetota bacterium]
MVPKPPRRPPASRLRLVQDARALDAFLDAAGDAEHLAIDTEANSMHAYRERVCLIQVSVPAGDFLLDPLADLDLDPFLDLCEDERVIKVLHDAEFDILLLGREYGVRLANLFDTKVAAVALGRSQVGLAALVEASFGVTLDKSQQRSDWGRRPLDRAQLEYAWKDTHFLLPLRERLLGELEDAPRLVRDEVAGECARLCALDWKRKEDPLAWRRLKGGSRLDPTQSRALEQLWRWREQEAERRDVPPFKVLPHAAVVAIARRSPKDRRELGQLLSGRPLDRYGDRLLAVLDKARKKGPLVVEKPKPLRGDARRRADAARAALERLKAWRKRQADRRPTDPSLVLNREVMERLVELDPHPADLDELAACGLLEPWRVEAYGEAILAALHGDRAPRR